MLCSVAANPGVEAVVGGRTETHEIVGYNNEPLARKSILVGIKVFTLLDLRIPSCTFDTMSETLDF